MDENHDFEEQWRAWSTSEPVFDERRLKANLRQRLPKRRPPRSVRLVLVAAAVSMLALLIGYESSRSPANLPIAVAPEVVYETGPNVILVFREGGDPIYVVTKPAAGNEGE